MSRPRIPVTPGAICRSHARVAVIGRRLGILADGKAVEIHCGRLRPLPERESVSMPLQITT
jgi:hypothetical protein